MKKENPILILIPSYIGNIKFFEKLTPYLKNYNIAFLFIPKVNKEKDVLVEEMKQYCQEKNYQYFELTNPCTKKLLKIIPFYYPLKNFYFYRKNVRSLFNNKSIKKIISVVDLNFYYKLLFHEANLRGIETMLMQWALTHEYSIKKKNNEKKYFLKTFYFNIVSLLLKFIGGIKNNKVKVLGGGNTNKFGVINEPAFRLFKSAGVDEKKMSIIGYIDFHEAEKKYLSIKKNKKLQNSITKRLGINSNKKIITIFTTPFNVKDLKILSKIEQINYYKKIVSNIRIVFNKKEADIYLKIHPAESKEKYSSLKEFEVKIFDKNIHNEELIFFTDLYIAHHSTTNYIPIIMNKNSIFINLLNLELIELTKKYFGIIQYINNYKMFNKLLSDFKNNRLDKQYSEKEKIITPDSLKKILNWIG